MKCTNIIAGVPNSNFGHTSLDGSLPYQTIWKARAQMAQRGRVGPCLIMSADRKSGDIIMSVDRKSSLARCYLTRDDHFVAISPTPPPFSAHIPEYVNPATAQSRQIETPVASLGIKFPFLVVQAPWWYVQRFREGHSLVMCLLPRLMRQFDIY